MDMKSIILLIFKLLMLGLFLGPFFSRAHALDELFHVYDSPQGLAMGNAYTADATGYAANYYNPAGLAKGTLTKWEVTFLAAEGSLSLTGIGKVLGAQSFGVHRVLNKIRGEGGYFYERGNLLASVQKRGFGFAILGSSELAESSNGDQLDIRFTRDVVPTFGAGFNLAGNLIKIGAVGKLIARQQVKGTYLHEELATPEQIDAQFKQGLAFGADIGFHLTLPNAWLPSLGFVWKDIFGTRFVRDSMVFATNENGRPDNIDQSFNIGVSVHPHLSNSVYATFAAEVKHLELREMSYLKRLHLGAQLEINRSFYLWAGLNQFYPTGGMGLRVKGGNLDVGIYTVDVGEGDERASNMRTAIRYTIGF